jgi:WD40 repeat protein
MSALPTDVEALIAANPFPGLRAFQPGEADRFFGRRQQIDELAAKLADTPFIAVSGASGCGKSSLVLAGLLSELRRRHDEDFDTDWRPVVMRPGNRPIAHLAAPLAAVLDGGRGDAPPAGDDAATAPRADALYGQLRLGGLGLVEAVRQSRLPAGARVLVVVDQFEEIFRFKRMADPDEASAFVKLLLQAAADPASPVSVVITLRSDTLGACADFRDLPEAASRGGYLVPRLRRDQRKEAIVRPVELRGARIAPRLVQRLLNDVSDDFDDLPIMQHALSRTWQHWARACGGTRPIDLEDYLAVGGAAQALNQHADEACRSLGALGEPDGMVERVFRALTERVAEGTEVRRPLDYAQLCAVCAGDSAQAIEQVGQVVERYRRGDTAFLVPGADRPLADNPVIDISHESLIRQWDRLRGWVLIEAEAASELRDLLREAEAHLHAKGELRRGLDLARARDWQRRHRPNPAWLRLCLGGSAAQASAQLETIDRFLDQSAESERRARRRDRLRRLSLRTLVGAVLVVSLGAAVVGLTLQRQARSRELVSHSVLALAQDPVHAAQLALAALDQDRRNPRADYALRQAMSALDVARTEQIVRFDEPLHEARYTADGQRLVVGGGRKVWLLDAGSLKTLAQVTAPAVVIKAWQLGEQVITYTDDFKLRLLGLDGRTRATLACDGEGNSASSVAYNDAHDSLPAQLAVGCYNGELLLWTLGPAGVLGRQLLQRGDDRAPTVNALGFSGDGAYLASGDAAGKALVWKRGVTDQPWIGGARGTPLQHAKAIRDINFHPSDSSLLATASDDATARVWLLDLDGRRLASTADGQPNQYQLPHDRAVLGARFVARADDLTPLMTRSDKRVFFWSNAKTFDARSHSDWVTDAHSSKDGELLVSASADSTAQLWSSRSATSIAVLRGHHNEVTRAIFSPQGDVVITASRDRSLRKWRLTRPVMLAAGRVWQQSAAIDPQAARAVLCGEARPAQPSQCRIAPLVDLAQRADTDQEWLEPVTADSVEQVSFSHDGHLVLGVSASHDVYQTTEPVLWDATSHHRLKPAWLYTWGWARFNPGRAELVTVRPAERGAGSEVAVWPQSALAAADAPQPLFSARIPQGQAGRAALSADGRWLALQLGPRVLLWDRRQSQAAPRKLSGHQGDVRSLAFSGDSQALVTASTDRTARVWPLGTASTEPVVLQGGHAAALSSAVFSPDGRYVLTGSADSSLRLWDAVSGRELTVINRHADAVNEVLFGPDGESLLSASDDGTVRFDRCGYCKLPLDTLQARARDVVQLIGPLRDDEPPALRLIMPPRWLGGG